MKLSSTNVTVVSSEEMGYTTIRQNGREPAFVETQHLEELRDLINDILEMQRCGCVYEN